MERRIKVVSASSGLYYCFAAVSPLLASSFSIIFTNIPPLGTLSRTNLAVKLLRWKVTNWEVLCFHTCTLDALACRSRGKASVSLTIKTVIQLATALDKKERDRILVANTIWDDQ